MLRLLKKSLSIEIFGFIDSLNQLGENAYKSITSSAFIQNRHKIKPDLFDDLNKEITNDFYIDNDENVKLFGSMRVLAIDGSTNLLPPSHELITYFGSINNQNIETKICLSRVSILYDVLNELILDAKLKPFKIGEIALANEHINHIKANDLIIMDRGYPCFETSFKILQKDAHFLYRCKKDYSKESKKFYMSGMQEETIDVLPNAKNGYNHLPYNQTDSIKVRFIRVILSTGEVEILMTSLLNKVEYPYAIFKELYFLRWKIEGFYDAFKNLIDVENYCGTSVKFITQEFYCAVYLFNMHSIILKDVEEEILEKYSKRKHKYKANKSISLGILRQKIIQIMMSKSDEYLDSFQKLIIDFVIPIIPDRKYRRHKEKYRTRAKPKGLKNNRNIF